MKKILGVPITKGVSIGYAYKIIPFRRENYLRKIKCGETEKEVLKFDNLVEKTSNILKESIKEISTIETKNILSVQIEILKDPSFKKNVISLINDELICLEHAISKHFLQVKNIFSKIKNPYLKQRSQDFEGVANKLFEVLDGDKNSFKTIPDNAILFVEDLTPTDVVVLSNKKIKGVCVEKGVKTAHAFIIIKSIGVKTVINLNNILKKVKNGDLIILDSNIGKIFISPKDDLRKKYEKIIEQEKIHNKKLKKIRDLPAKTKTGKTIKIMANIEIPQEIFPVIKNRALGIGLMRTEFLYMNRSNLPTLKEQFNIYKDLAIKIKPHPLTIRTIDMGGDKDISILKIGREENPNLGLRGIRFSLFNIDIFKTQIKAILKASNYGNIRIMLPMVSDLWEIKKIKKIIEKCKKELLQENILFNKNIEIGIMIETPSTIFLLESFLKNCDFLSIGTNDLIQYLFAVDRNNSNVQHYYNNRHPILFEIIKNIVKKAHKKNISVAICGEMAGDLKIIKKLIKIDVDEISVNPSSILEVKEAIINLEE